MITNVWYDVGAQDQWTDTATVDDNGNVSATTSQYIQTYFVLDDGSGSNTIPPLFVARSAVDPVTGLAVPSKGERASINGDASFIVTRVQPKRSTKSPFLFEVQIQYDSKTSYQPPDASKWNITLSIAGSKATEPCYEAVNHDTMASEPVTNSALEAFDPPPQKTHYFEQITVGYNTNSPPDFSTLRGCVNSGTVSFTIKGVSRSFSANQLLLDDYNMSITLSLADQTPVWKVSATLQGLSGNDSDGNPVTFTQKILDAGFRTLSSGKTAVILDQYNQPVNTPQMLDGSGGKLSSGGTPVYRKYDIEDTADLNPVFDGLTD